MAAGGFSFGNTPAGTSGGIFGTQPAARAATTTASGFAFGSTLGSTTAGGTSGFSLGAAAAAAVPKPTLNLGTTFGAAPTAAVAPTTGLSLGGTPGGTFGATFGTPAATGLGGTPAATVLGGTPAATTTGFSGFGTPAGTGLGGTPAATTGLGGTPAAATGLGGTPAATGLGGTPAATGLVSGGVSFGATAATTAATTGFGATTGLTLGGTTGLNLGTTQAGTLGMAQPATGLALGSTPAATGLTLGGTGLASTGLTLGGTPAAQATTGLTLGGAATTVGTGLPFGTTTTKAGVTFGGLGGTTTASGLTLGAATTTTSSLFGSAVATTTASRGLGGVDPKTTQPGGGSTATSDKPGDSKAVKETQVPGEICATVEDFKKYVKEQKTTREQITRMSAKSRFKVQEEVATLQQLLSVVSNGLQRNALAIHRLKAESAQELKHAEISQRTKDTPPGLQYENTAPAEYFQRLVEDFEVRMMTYRQQIEEMESHLASLNQSSMLTPQELSMLLDKLHQSFLALAAQLQVVHESVKTQKEHFLNYRKVFHGDPGDIFQKRRKVEEHTGSRVVVTTVGPTPFTGMSNAAAVAMAGALNRTQPVAPPTAGTALVGGFGIGSSTTTGLFGTGGGFGAPAARQGSGSFGGFGSSGTQTAAVRPLGSTFGTGGTTLFGSTPATTAQSGGLNFGTSFGTPGTAGFNTTGLSASGPAGFAQTNNFQLAKPPAGNKRGKR